MNPTDITSRFNQSQRAVYRRNLRRLFRRSKKRTIRYSLLLANAVLLIGVGGFILHNSGASRSALHSTLLASTNSSSAVAANPLDRLSSADIAVHVARLTGLEESTSVTNHAESVGAQLTFAPGDDKITTKPQIVAGGEKSPKDIRTYQAIAGDTVTSVAAKFGITSDSVRWSNDITGENLIPGRELVISPINGIIYTVAAGDNVDSIATRFKINKDRLIAFNDAEVSGLKAGQRIVVPDGTKPPVAPIFTAAPPSFSVGLAVWGGGGGGYDRGWCTDYAAARGGAPPGWGNASTWDNYAPLSGWTVSTVPRVGAIAQTDAGGWGHVGIVEAVSEDGTQIKYSDMNGLAGWNRVGYSDWVPVHSKFPRFIYH